MISFLKGDTEFGATATSMFVQLILIFFLKEPTRMQSLIREPLNAKTF